MSYVTHLMDNPPTKLDTLLNTQAIAKKYLSYVYLGNVSDIDMSNCIQR